jgi:hypothetical protein
VKIGIGVAGYPLQMQLIAKDYWNYWIDFAIVKVLLHIFVGKVKQIKSCLEQTSEWMFQDQDSEN